MDSKVALQWLAANVERLRRKRGWSYQVLGDHAENLSSRTARQAALGQTVPSVRTLVRLAKALGVKNPGDLLFDPKGPKDVTEK